MKRNKIRNLTYVSLCVAIMAVLSQIAIPVGAVPLTIQSFVVALVGYFLGVKAGLCTVAVYILLGLVGAPVFAGFQGGFHTLISYTGGFIFGYLPFVILCGIRGKRWQRIALGTVGLVLCHLCGTVQYMLLAEMSFWKAALVVSLPFLVKDVFLVVGAYFVSEVLNKRLKR